MSEPVSEYNADTLIDELEAATLVSQRRFVIRALFSKFEALSALQRDAIAAYDCGELDSTAWSERLWPEIEALPLEQQGSLRLLVALVNQNAVLDPYEAEFLIDWSRQCGLSERQIGEAFHQR